MGWKSLTSSAHRSLPPAEMSKIRLRSSRGATTPFQTYHGPEFIASSLEVWAHDHTFELPFIQPRKPTQNALIESFNSRVRNELLMTSFSNDL